MSKIDELEKLQKLKESGALSEEEFSAEKAKILNSEQHKKKSHTGLIIVVVIAIVIGGLCLLSNNIWKSSGKHEKSFTTNSRDTNNNNDTNNNSQSTNKYESQIKDKWKKTLPLNSTKGLKCAVYSINQQTLYLEYDLGICIIDENNDVNRYMDGDIKYISAQINISNARNGNSGYIYMTVSKFESLIENSEDTSASKKSTNTLLEGNHKIVYVEGIGTNVSDVTGYIKLNTDNTFKIYVKYNSLELMNIEGTYTITGDKISINIAKEGGYDLGSQSRKDEIIIAQDNLAYANMKFAK